MTSALTPSVDPAGQRNRGRKGGRAGAAGLLLWAGPLRVVRARERKGQGESGLGPGGLAHVSLFFCTLFFF